MWKKPLAAVAAAGLLIAGTTGAVMAVTTTGRSPVNCMDATWQKTSVSTSSMDWTDVPGLQANPTEVFPMLVDVSATVSGAPAGFRVVSTNVGEQTRISNPGATQFDPGANGPNAFSYQWVKKGDSGAPHAILLQLQWRSPSGDEVTLLRGDMAVLYRTDGCIGGP